MTWLKWFVWLIVAAWVSWMAGLAVSNLAEAHDWYGELMVPGPYHSRCCGGEDCAPYPYRMNDSETAYEAFIRGQWWPIPPDKIIQDVLSPDGQLHACCHYTNVPGGSVSSKNGCETKDPVIFRCVVVPQGSA